MPAQATTSLEQPLVQARPRTILNGKGGSEPTWKGSEPVGDHPEKQAHLTGPEPVAGEPGPVGSFLAFVDPLLSRVGKSSRADRTTRGPRGRRPSGPVRGSVRSARSGCSGRADGPTRPEASGRHRRSPRPLETRRGVARYPSRQRGDPKSHIWFAFDAIMASSVRVPNRKCGLNADGRGSPSRRRVRAWRRLTRPHVAGLYSRRTMVTAAQSLSVAVTALHRGPEAMPPVPRADCVSHRVDHSDRQLRAPVVCVGHPVGQPAARRHRRPMVHSRVRQGLPDGDVVRSGARSAVSPSAERRRRGQPAVPGSPGSCCARLPRRGALVPLDRICGGAWSCLVRRRGFSL